MTPSHDLFKLIKSLSSTEKAYFKKHSSFTRQDKGGNIYLTLFDAIAKQNEYDESKLKKKFKGQTFVKQFPVIKNYLYSKVLDALELYHSDMNQRFLVRKMMNRAELLRKRGMYDQAMKILKKGKVFAKENEMHLSLLDMNIHVELGLALEKFDMNWVEQVNKEITHNLALFKNDAAMHDVNFKIAIFYHNYLITRNPSFLKSAKQIVNSVYLSDVSKAKTFFGKNRFYESHAFYALAKGDLKSIHYYTKKVVENFENSQNKITKNFISYVAALNNFIEICGELRKYDEGMEYLAKLKSYPDLLNSYSINAKIFFVYNYLYLFLHNNSGHFQDSKELLAEIQKELKLYEEEMNHSEKGVLFVNIAITYFGLGEIKLSIQWLNKIRNELSLLNNPELDCFVRMFYLVAHYELDNKELVAYLIRADARFFSKKQSQFEIESVFLDFMKNKLPSATDNDSKIKLFRKLRDSLIPLVNNPQDKIYFKYFDFINWLDSKIKGVSFQQLVRDTFSSSK